MSLVGSFLTGILTAPATEKAAAGFLASQINGNAATSGFLGATTTGSAQIGGVTVSSGGSSTKTDYVLYIVLGIVVLVLLVVSLFTGKKKSK